MKMSKVGNQTNSQDPQAVNSRVFVGNLNTFQCSKTDVERMFQRYGRLAGISMHKGYAFVQFTNPFDARSACLGEDGRTVLGQILDVNMVAEPKPHQTGRKRQNVAKTGNDWDYYYDSYYASAGAAFPGGLGAGGRLVPPLKRPRLMTHAAVAAQSSPLRPPLVKALHKAAPQIVSPVATPTNNNSSPTVLSTQVAQLKTYSNPDILICGNCREMFTELQELMDHKKSYCKLRFTCKCSVTNGAVTKGGSRGGDQDLDHNGSGSTTVSLMCVQCKDSFFGNAWDLMVHVQAAHMLNIYELGVPPNPHPNGVASHPSNGTQVTTSSCTASLHDERLSSEESPEPVVQSPGGSPHVNNHVSAQLELDNGGERDMMTSPATDMDEDLPPQVESTAQACIMHALHIENGAGALSSAAAKILVKPITNGELVNAHE